MDGCDGTTIWSLQQFVDAHGFVRPPGGARAGRPGAADAGQRVAVDDRRRPPVGRRRRDRLRQRRGSAYRRRAGRASPAACAASIPGVTVNSVTVNSPTSVTLNLSTRERGRRRQADHRHQPRRPERDRRQPAATCLGGPAMAIETPAAGHRRSAARRPRLGHRHRRGSTGTGVDVVQIYADAAPAARRRSSARPTTGSARSDIGAATSAHSSPTSGFSFRAATVAGRRGRTRSPSTRTAPSPAPSTRSAVAVTLTGTGRPDRRPRHAGRQRQRWPVKWASRAGRWTTAASPRSTSTATAVASEPAGLMFIGHATFVRGARPTSRRCIRPTSTPTPRAGA